MTDESAEKMRPSALFRWIRKQYPKDRADRIIAFMSNGMFLSSAIAATEQ